MKTKTTVKHDRIAIVISNNMVKLSYSISRTRETFTSGYMGAGPNDQDHRKVPHAIIQWRKAFPMLHGQAIEALREMADRAPNFTELLAVLNKRPEMVVA